MNEMNEQTNGQNGQNGQGRVEEEGQVGQAVYDRLEYLRKELRAERISYGELAELQSLARYIEASDVELLEAAGVPEHPESQLGELSREAIRLVAMRTTGGLALEATELVGALAQAETRNGNGNCKAVLERFVARAQDILRRHV